jgi:hypothetical protein
MIGKANRIGKKIVKNKSWSFRVGAKLKSSGTSLTFFNTLRPFYIVDLIK